MELVHSSLGLAIYPSFLSILVFTHTHTHTHTHTQIPVCVCVEGVLAVVCVSAWRTMPSVCLYSDREIALSLLTLSLCITGQLHCVCVCVCVCVCERVIMSYCRPSLFAFQGSLLSDETNLCHTIRTCRLMNGFLWTSVTFSRLLRDSSLSSCKVILFLK